MLTKLLKWIVGSAILGSLFWCSGRECVALLLAVWAVAIATFVYSDLADRFIWIPIFLALAGVFGSIFVLWSPATITLVANVATLVLFVVSMEMLKKRRLSVVAMRHRAGMKA